MQAKSALALKRVIKVPPNALFPFKPTQNSSQQERLRATLRGALDHRTEADISESAFLGRATKDPVQTTTAGKDARPTASVAASHQKSTGTANVSNQATLDGTGTTTTSSSHADSTSHKNPVDEMMQLERELRDMDMTLEMGNSIASLDARNNSTQAARLQRISNSVAIDGSFMVVPPGSGSFMSSSSLSSSILNSPSRNANHHHHPVNAPGIGTAGVRARANRVQNLVVGGGGTRSAAAATGTSASPANLILPAPPTTTNRNQSLESSWWGNSSAASQVLASSVSSLASMVPVGHGGEMPARNLGGASHQPTNTKQLMRLMDSLKTLGDENAALLRQVEGAETARIEAKAAKEQMKRFKEEYGKRFASLKEALEKFRKGYPDHSSGTEVNPVTSSEFLRTASTTEQLHRQEQLIKKLTADLKKEKEESKKKDAALRKYESFYREVKARSAQKAAQRQKETQQQQRHQPPPSAQQPPHAAQIHQQHSRPSAVRPYAR